MATTDTQEDELILAQLAIKLGGKADTATGPAPDSEELMALADQSLVDPTRRAQVLSHIASNPEIYKRWLDIVEAISGFEAGQAGLPVIQDKTSRGWLARIGSWIFGSNVRAGVFGGGMATAAAVVAAVILIPILGKLVSLDEQYDEMLPIIEGQWDTVPHNKKSPSSGDTRAFQFLTEPQSVVEYAFHLNAARLGKSRYEAIGIIIKDDIAKPEKPQDVSDSQLENLNKLGKLTALTALQCDLTLDKKIYKNSFTIAQSILEELKTISDEKLYELAHSLKDTKHHNASVCAMTDKVLAMLF